MKMLIQKGKMKKMTNGFPETMKTRCPLRIFAGASPGLACLFTLSAAFAADPQDGRGRPADMEILLQDNCYDCHDDITQKGNVRLDTLAEMPLDDRLNLLNKMLEQVYIEEMPPRDKKSQPSEDERKQIVAWLSGELKKHNASKLEYKLQKPGYGNYISHENLFNGQYKNLPGFTYDRKWLISEYIFKEKTNAILQAGKSIKIDNKSYELRGLAGRAEVVNPFLLPKITGVRYFSNEELNSGHFLTMVGNAEYLANYMIGVLRKKNPDYLPVVTKLTDMSDKHNAILNNRKKFLTSHIDDVCAEMSGSQNNSLLPAYTPLPMDEFGPRKESYGKHGWRNRIGAADGEALVFALKKFEAKSSSKEDLVRKCEQYWVYFGVDKTTIERRLDIFKKELVTILDYANYKSAPAIKYQRLDTSEMEIITSTISKYRTKGMPYNKLIQKCMEHWDDEFSKLRESSDSMNNDLVTAMLDQLYEIIHERPSGKEEAIEQAQLFRAYSARVGVDGAIRKLAQTLLLSTEFVNRNEYGAGQADQHGRRMLSPRDASYAIAYALTDSSPDEELVKAAQEGKLQTREDYEREVLRMLNDKSRYYIIDNLVHGSMGVQNITKTPIRKLRFFREFFGYPKALDIFKDDVRFGPNGSGSHKQRLIAEADMLVDHILEKDKKVIEELLSTEDFYVFHNGDDEEMLRYTEPLRKTYDYFKDKDWKNIKTYDELMQHRDFIASVNVLSVDTKAKDSKAQKESLDMFKKVMTSITSRFSEGAEYIAPFVPVKFASYAAQTKYKIERNNSMRGEAVMEYFNIDYKNGHYSPQQPTKISNRKGMLTHPAWLMAHASNFHTDPVIRGKWIREKLLAGSVPDVPITVDAVIPQDHTRTLRDRLHSKTIANECWRCHERMNPLGNTFELYDDFGRFRTEEELEHPDNIIKSKDSELASKESNQTGRIRYKTLPVDPTGVLDGTGNSQLDGEVKDAFDLIGRLVKSDKVRQSVIRHAFRYFMGRNEMLSDSKTLIDADEAYLKSGGSFDAVIVSLLTSDSFIYRKPNQN